MPCIKSADARAGADLEQAVAAALAEGSWVGEVGGRTAEGQ